MDKIEHYIQQFPDDVQEILRTLRALIKKMHRTQKNQ
jgi:hypothetical protein